MSPSQYLTFPLLHTPNLSNGGSSFSQKCPTILNSKAMGLLRRARVSRSKKEGDSDSFPQQLLSSWHVAPVHLPLLGQNCWPHLSEGFSVSLWFNVERIHEAESTTEKGKKTKKRNKSLILLDSNFGGTGMTTALSVALRFFQRRFYSSWALRIQRCSDLLSTRSSHGMPQQGRLWLTEACVVR